MDKVTIGRVVIYRSRTGSYDVPAIVTATVDTLNPAGVEAGAIPPLSSEDHVHLTVLTPGFPGRRERASDLAPSPVEEAGGPRSENVAGTYQEWDVPPAGPLDDPIHPDPGPGTWRWPERV